MAATPLQSPSVLEAFGCGLLPTFSPLMSQQDQVGTSQRQVITPLVSSPPRPTNYHPHYA